MTRTSLSKSQVSAVLFRYLGWKALALAAIMIGILALWQLGLARHKQSVSQLWSSVKDISSSSKESSSTATRSANDVKLRAPYDLSLITLTQAITSALTLCVSTR